MAKTMRSGDQGVIFKVRVTADGGIVNLSAYTFTTKEFVFKAPSGATFSRPAVFSGTGADGLLQYVCTAADFVEPGNWSVQAHLVASAPSALVWRSSLDTFEVQSNL